jgi:hypothetical protein
MDGRRKAEEARNLVTAIRIRDDEGGGSAADRTVRLKAIGVIEGASDKASVAVNVNQQTNNLVAGYVICLPASRAEGAPTIEGSGLP